MRKTIVISILLLFVVALSATFLSPTIATFNSESPPGYQNETPQQDFPGTIVTQDVELKSSTIRSCDTQTNRYDSVTPTSPTKSYRYWSPCSVYTLLFS